MAVLAEVVAQVKIRNFDFGIFYLFFYCMEITGKVRKISATRCTRLWRNCDFLSTIVSQAGMDIPASGDSYKIDKMKLGYS